VAFARQGLLFAPPGGVPFVASHAALPVVTRSNALHRVYFSGRDRKGRARVAFFETDLHGPPGVVQRVSERPALDLGALGAFDDSGVTTSCLVESEGRLHLFYTGWSLGVTVPFYLAAGRAVSDDGGLTLRRTSAAPVLDRSDSDPYLTASPWVLLEGGVWRMWYVSGTRWEATPRGPRHYYDIRYAESADGRRFTATGRVCLTYTSPGEHAFARPCVVKDGALYRMWFAARGERYLLGYAESADGLTWERDDLRAGLTPSEEGFDSEMLCYPFVFDDEGTRYLLYNGNDYGRTGIGLAVEVKEAESP
jgi:hypothetical protein